MMMALIGEVDWHSVASWKLCALHLANNYYVSELSATEMLTEKQMKKLLVWHQERVWNYSLYCGGCGAGNHYIFVPHMDQRRRIAKRAALTRPEDNTSASLSCFSLSKILYSAAELLCTAGD